jgi:3-deoxy-D-manno-octulosonic-acid transferase
MLAELAAPIFGVAAYSRSGAAAARQVLGWSTERRPTSADYLLWVHGASIGETRSTLPLVRALLARDPGAHVLITASTPTALTSLAMEGLGPRVLLQQRPADVSSVLRRFLEQWRPNALLLVESELWPNLLVRTHSSGVPIALVNARLSARSLERWRAIAPFTLRRLLACCSITLAQSPQMARELCELIASGETGGHACAQDPGKRSPAHVAFRGDLKQLPGRTTEATTAILDSLRRDLGPRVAQGGVWLAASTHAGEESLILQAHAALRTHGHPDLLLILVPRHPERGPEVAAVAGASMLETRQGGVLGHRDGAVALRSTRGHVGPETAVYVCDTLGELSALYGFAGIAFVGGSLVPRGGHSLLEAAQAPGGCVVLHGQHIEAVEHAAAALAAANPPAARQINGAVELAACVDELLSDDALRAACRDASSATARSLEYGVLEDVWAELRAPLGLPPFKPRPSRRP